MSKKRDAGPLVLIYTKRSVTMKNPLFEKKHLLAKTLQDGVFLSNEVISLIKKKTGLSDEAARKNLSRAGTDEFIWRSSKLRLSQNRRIFSHRSFLGTEAFARGIVGKLKVERPGLARCIEVLLRREVLLVSEAAKLLASPTNAAPKSKFPSLEKEIQSLLELQFIRREGSGTPLDRICLSKMANTAKEKAVAQSAFARKFIEDQLLEVVLYQFAIQNFIAWGAVERQTVHSFNGYPFSGFSFSYLRPLLRSSKGKHATGTPIVFDIYSDIIDVQYVSGFVERITRAGYNPRVNLPIFGVIAAKGFSREAFGLAKKTGLITINLEQMFGDEALKVLVQAEKILSKIPSEESGYVEADITLLTESISQLKTHPYFEALRSLSFETAAFAIISSMGWQDVRMNTIVPANADGKETSRDVDVSGKRSGGDEVILIECKGESIGKELDAAYVRKFFTQTVPGFLKTHPDHSRIKKCHAGIWTTGVVGKSAIEALKEINFKASIEPSILQLDQLEQIIPSTLGPIKRLVACIAGKGLVEKSVVEVTTVQPTPTLFDSRLTLK